MPAGRVDRRWEWLAGALLALVAALPAWSQAPRRPEKMPEVWVGTHRVSATPKPAVERPTLPAEAKIAAPPELKRMPFRRLDPPESAAPKMTELKPGTEVARAPANTVTHHTTLMPAATTLPEYPARRPARRARGPLLPHGRARTAARDARRRTSSPATRDQRSSYPNHHAGRRARAAGACRDRRRGADPTLRHGRRQMVGVLAALSISAASGWRPTGAGAHGTSLPRPSASRSSPPAAGAGHPAVDDAAAQGNQRPRAGPDDEPPIEPNFEMPLTYEEEMGARKENEKQQELACSSSSRHEPRGTSSFKMLPAA